MKLRTAAMLRGEMLGSAGSPAAFKLSRDHAKNAERNEKICKSVARVGRRGAMGAMRADSLHGQWARVYAAMALLSLVLSLKTQA